MTMGDFIQIITLGLIEIENRMILKYYNRNIRDFL